MKFIVLFEDSVEADPDIRKTHMRDHLSFLERNADVIEAAGPLSDSSHKGRDGLWIVDAENTEAVEHLIRQDPFWPTGLRAAFSVLPWKQVYAGGRRLVDP